MSTKSENIANINSCLNKAANDEPIFVLRANDYMAPAIVTMWAVKYVQDKGGWDRMSPTQRAKHAEALAVAEAMRQWRQRKEDEDIPF